MREKYLLCFLMIFLVKEECFGASMPVRSTPSDLTSQNSTTTVSKTTPVNTAPAVTNSTELNMDNPEEPAQQNMNVQTPSENLTTSSSSNSQVLDIVKSKIKEILPNSPGGTISKENMENDVKNLSEMNPEKLKTYIKFYYYDQGSDEGKIKDLLSDAANSELIQEVLAFAEIPKKDFGSKLKDEAKTTFKIGQSAAKALGNALWNGFGNNSCSPSFVQCLQNCYYGQINSQYSNQYSNQYSSDNQYGNNDLNYCLQQCGYVETGNLQGNFFGNSQIGNYNSANNFNSNQHYNNSIYNQGSQNSIQSSSSPFNPSREETCCTTNSTNSIPSEADLYCVGKTFLSRSSKRAITLAKFKDSKDSEKLTKLKEVMEKDYQCIYKAVMTDDILQKIQNNSLNNIT